MRRGQLKDAIERNIGVGDKLCNWKRVSGKTHLFARKAVLGAGAFLDLK